MPVKPGYTYERDTLTKCSYEYLLKNFYKFTQPNKIRVALEIVKRDMSTEADKNGIQRVINIINSYSTGANTGPGSRVSTSQVAEGNLESPCEVQTDMLAPEGAEDNSGDKQTDKGVLPEREESVCLHSADIHPSESDNMARPTNVKAVPTERTFIEGSE